MAVRGRSRGVLFAERELIVVKRIGVAGGNDRKLIKSFGCHGRYHLCCGDRTDAGLGLKNTAAMWIELTQIEPQCVLSFTPTRWSDSRLDVGYWHLADVAGCPLLRRYWGVKRTS